MTYVRETSAGYLTNWAARLFARALEKRLVGGNSGPMPVFFALQNGRSMTQKALAQLAAAFARGAWFAELIPTDASSQREELANVLLAGFVERAVQLHSIAPADAPTISDWPVASPLARLHSVASPLVTNLWHDVVTLEPAVQQLLVHLTGQNDRASLKRIATSLPQLCGPPVDVDALLRHIWKRGLLIS